MMTAADTTLAFWTALETAVNPTNYRPLRNAQVIVTRLETDGEAYYVLKHPTYKNYMQLDAGDYALWWQMDGHKTIKNLLIYSLKRYQSLPIGRLNDLVDDLRAGHFLADQPTNLYVQVEAELARRSPAKRGERFLLALMETKWEISGLDGFFSQLYRLSRYLYTPLLQGLMLLLLIVGGLLFAREIWQQNYTLFDTGGWSFLTLVVLNLFVIGIHELAHGITVKHFGRELNRGGFLIYWGLPAFFVDTRDIWLAPLRERLWVVWAGPYSGLIIGGLAGVLLTAVSPPIPINTLLYQLGFLAYLSVLVNLNPLLELDGYFMLMDWLDMPNLRQRAFNFWRVDLRAKLHTTISPTKIWANSDKEARIFVIYGGLAFVYGLVAVGLAIYFWRTRIGPFAMMLWQMGVWGQGLLLLATAVLCIPAAYFLTHISLARLRNGYDWLAKHHYLDKTWVAAALIGVALLIVGTAVWFLLTLFPLAALWQTLFIWILLLAAGWCLYAVARQLAGSRLQAVFWAFLAVIVGLGVVWIKPDLAGSIDTIWPALGWLLAASAVLTAGGLAWWTVHPVVLGRADYGLMAGFVGLGLLNLFGFIGLGHSSRTLFLLLFLLTTGSLLMCPLLLNFWRTRFTLAWFFFLLAVWLLPWAAVYPQLQNVLILAWLFAGLLYWFVGSLAWFARQALADTAVSSYDARTLLISSYQHYCAALFAAYEPEFGRRPLAALQRELAAQLPLDATVPIWSISQQIQQQLVSVNDRLDDIAGAVFTRRAGQAAYDSLPWLEAETLGRHVLANSTWGVSMAQGFILKRDQYSQFMRQADIFAGFDHETTQDLLAIARQQSYRTGERLAQQGADATQFFLVVAGSVGVFRAGIQAGFIDKGGYFGTRALLDTGVYSATYRALEQVTVLQIERAQFDPLWRADTTLASQVQIQAHERGLLQKMTLFAGLSAQQLTAVAARLQRRYYSAGTIIVQQGAPRSYFFIVDKGEVEVVAEDGRNGRMGSGEHFGEYALFADTPYRATYRAATAAELLLLDEPTFDRLAAECAQLAHYTTQIGSGHILASRVQTGPTGLWA